MSLIFIREDMLRLRDQSVKLESVSRIYRHGIEFHFTHTRTRYHRKRTNFSNFHDLWFGPRPSTSNLTI